MSTNETTVGSEKQRILVAVYPDEEKANAVLERLIDDDFQMDRISVLGRIHASGDDPLGIYSLNAGERMKVWGTHGAIWGGLWGMLAGAAGLFIIPGIGTLAAAGYIVEAIAGGVAIGGGAMAGAAAVTQLAVAFHRTGIPQETIVALHNAIEAGKFLVMLRGDESEIPGWRAALESDSPLEIHDLPYSPATDQNRPSSVR